MRAVRGRALAGRGDPVTLALGSSDSIEPPPARSLTCCARITRDGATGWCMLQDGHEGEHLGVLSTPPAPDGFGPRSKR